MFYHDNLYFKFMRRFIPFMSNISAFCNFDILWRFIQFLPSGERRYLAWRLLQDKADHITFRRDGIVWTANVCDLDIGMSLFRDGGHQLSELQALLTWMDNYGRVAPAYTTIIEVGANIGSSTIPLAHRTNCHVYAIEPVLENFQLLQQNIRQNGLDSRVTCCRCAIFSHSGTVQFLSPPRRSGQGMVAPHALEVVSPGGPDTPTLQEVSTETLTRLIASYKISPAQVAFVWSDTEGSEAHVIETGEELWVSGVPLYVELYPDALRKQRSLQNFVGLANRHFEQFVDIRDILKQGIKATRCSVAGLQLFIEDLEQNNMMMTDILLLPGDGRL